MAPRNLTPLRLYQADDAVADQPPPSDRESRCVPAAVGDAVRQLYDDLDREISARNPRCQVSGKCCRFKEYGHTLFLSNLEAAVLLEKAPPYSPEMVTDAFCPFQVGNLCTARDHRPVGCRVYFCEPGFESSMSELTEQAVRRLKNLAEAEGLRWLYAPLHTFLRDPDQAILTSNTPSEECNP